GAAGVQVGEHAAVDAQGCAFLEDDVDDPAGPLGVEAGRGIGDHLDACDLVGGELLQERGQRLALHGGRAAVDVDPGRAAAQRDGTIEVDLDVRDAGEQLGRHAAVGAG